MIEHRAAQNIFAGIVQSGSYHSFRGRAFEYVCMDHAFLLAELLGFAGVAFTHGPLFRRPSPGRAGFQIDLLFERADNVITLCEMKSKSTPLGIEIIDEVEKKALIIATEPQAKKIIGF